MIHHENTLQSCVRIVSYVKMTTVDISKKVYCLYLDDDPELRSLMARNLKLVAGENSATLVGPGHLEDFFTDLHEANPETIKDANFLVLTDGSMERVDGVDTSDTYKGGPTNRFSHIGKTCREALEVLQRWQDRIGKFFLAVITANPENHKLKPVKEDQLDNLDKYNCNPRDLAEVLCLVKPVSFKKVVTQLFNYFKNIVTASPAEVPM